MEYSALKKLIWIIFLYMFSFYLIAIFMLTVYLAFQPTAKTILQENGNINPFWWFVHIYFYFKNVTFHKGHYFIPFLHLTMLDSLYFQPI